MHESKEYKVESFRNLTPYGAAWGGIIFMGGLMPSLGFIGFEMRYWIVHGGYSLAEVSPILTELCLSCLGGALFVIVGTIAAFVLLQGVQFATGRLLTDRGASGVFGGLTAFVCVLTMSAIPAIESSYLVSGVTFFFFIAVGHLGGVWGCFRLRYELT